MKLKQVKVVFHFCNYDTDFREDYTSVDIYLDGVLATTYQDGYHDNGLEKARGFVDALKYLCGEDTFEYLIENIADFDEW